MIEATNNLNNEEGTYDVVVVGAGAAGLNAALLLGRARRKVAVVDAGEPRNAPASHMHGFLSRDGLPPATLLDLGRAEIARYGVRFLRGRVERIDRGHAGYQIRMADGAKLTARRVLVATGLRDELPDIPGVHERWGRDLLHCPYCHAYEVRERPLAVLGTQPGAVHQALLLRQWSDDVILLPHTLGLTVEDRERLEARGVRLVEGKIKQLVVDGDRLRGIELTDGRVVPRATAFLFPRPIPNDELLTRLGCDKDDNGWVVTDRTGRTSVAGVWAAGNVIDPRAQVVTAAGMGSAAGFAINTGLLDEDVDRAVAQRRASAATQPLDSTSQVGGEGR
ncbi:NAD(P)/FAD-dependent oxidoreductase [Amycolatopsis taiwanensis]|uniref:Thioredoxin reductase n=1 Tax=Amycolatopsis taiwanensis TaxID=342230 RepID=A0A9W6QZ69_9PSEU|nr:NAD(P)/FAD-dependent oxidoreductase [Amycolatopsis taiwanensis]GLY65581.1 thioredoxin reductase [Amycolatopsis taiwanensis]